MRTFDFHKGMKVRYVPSHVYGDHNHRDCENGVVSSVNDHFVFVKYGARIVTGDEPDTAQATKPEDLRILSAAGVLSE